MNRFVYPMFIDCDPLDIGAERNVDGSWRLRVDLKNAFHQGYIDRHGVVPRSEKNPFLDEYIDLLDDSDDLRFLLPGIGNDIEARIGESGKLGKCIARGILNQHMNYTWFASIQNLKLNPERGWTAEKRHNGNSPDWLVGSDKYFAVAEAKGVHEKIQPGSAKCNEWRTQVKNVRIKFDGKDQRLKTWVLATRFVSVAQPSDRPEMLLEDPPLEGEELYSYDSLLSWIARSHILSNLERLGQYRLAVRLKESLSRKFDLKVRVLVWKCMHPRLSHLRFIGRNLDVGLLAYAPFRWLAYLMFVSNSDNVVRSMSEWHMHFGANGFFDGMAIDPIKQLIENETPEPIRIEGNNLSTFEYISLLSDGSFVAPMDLMQPVEIKEF